MFVCVLVLSSSLVCACWRRWEELADVILYSRQSLKEALCWQLVAGASPCASDTHSHRGQERGNGTVRTAPLPTQLTHPHVQHAFGPYGRAFDSFSASSRIGANKIQRGKKRWSRSQEKVFRLCGTERSPLLCREEMRGERRGSLEEPAKRKPDPLFSFYLSLTLVLCLFIQYDIIFLLSVYRKETLERHRL